MNTRTLLNSCLNNWSLIYWSVYWYKLVLYLFVGVFEVFFFVPGRVFTFKIISRSCSIRAVTTLIHVDHTRMFQKVPYDIVPFLIYDIIPVFPIRYQFSTTYFQTKLFRFIFNPTMLFQNCCTTLVRQAIYELILSTLAEDTDFHANNKFDSVIIYFFIE